MSYTLCVPSWVIPDTWAGNLRFVAGKPYIQGVELLLYLWNDTVRRDFLRELPEIKSFSDRLCLSLHLPETSDHIEKDIVQSTASFVRSYCVHPPKKPEDTKAFVASLCALRDIYGDIFFLENTRLELFEKVHGSLIAATPGMDWPVCMDTAHLLKEGKSIASFLEHYGPMIREIHLNDHRAGKDHVALSPASSWLTDVIPFLPSFSGILELELFSIQEIDISLDALANFMHEGA